MIDKQLKQHLQSSAFFAQDNKYRTFDQQLAANHIDSRAVPFTQLVLKVCAYGYFQQNKDKMIKNFKQYLAQALRLCKDLTVLKIVLNGFVVNQSQQQHHLADILALIEQSIAQKKFKTVHFHTTNLRKCKQKDLVMIFNLLTRLGQGQKCQQVSFQMADWEFQQGYPQYLRLVDIFTSFVASAGNGYDYKKFRLEISSWYMKEKEAFRFLSQTLNEQILIARFKKESSQSIEGQIIEGIDFPSVPQNQREQTVNALVYFLRNMDWRYLQPKYPHKKNSQKFDHEEANSHSVMIQQMNRCQSIVGSRLMKYPQQFIMGLRVQQFHSKMASFLSQLLNKMHRIQQYHIDFRNWSGMFGMGSLKKVLDTKVTSNKKQFSGIRQSFVGNRQIKEGEEIGIKTIYTM